MERRRDQASQSSRVGEVDGEATPIPLEMTYKSQKSARNNRVRQRDIFLGATLHDIGSQAPTGAPVEVNTSS